MALKAVYLIPASLVARWEEALTPVSITGNFPRNRFQKPSRFEGFTNMDLPASSKTRVVLAGESWVSGGTHIKGSDVFTQPRYEEGGIELVRGLEATGIEVSRVPAHLVARDFPASVQELNRYDVVILSDVGADSFELTDDCLAGRRSVSRLRVLAEWVSQGGGLLMVGGYMSFSGMQGRARFQNSPLAEVLPVSISEYDDRVERPDGVEPKVVDSAHPIVADLPAVWPYVLGHNRVRAKEGASTLVAVDDDPFIVVGTHGSGRVAAYTSDCAPHWASRDFLEWSSFADVFVHLVTWLVGETAATT
jgi:uncharacterized membrane protein